MFFVWLGFLLTNLLCGCNLSTDFNRGECFYLNVLNTNQPPQMKKLFSNSGITHVIALRHAKPESGKVLSILSNESEEGVKELARLIKNYAVKGDGGVIIFHSHSIRVIHTAITMSRAIDHKNTLTVGHLHFGEQDFCKGHLLMEKIADLLPHFPGIKTVIFVGHYEAVPGLIDAVSRDNGGSGLECFEPGCCDGAMIDLETGKITKDLNSYFAGLEAVAASV